MVGVQCGTDSEQWALAFRRGQFTTRARTNVDIRIIAMYKVDVFPQTTCKAALPEPRAGGGP